MKNATPPPEKLNSHDLTHGFSLCTCTPAAYTYRQNTMPNKIEMSILSALADMGEVKGSTLKNILDYNKVQYMSDPKVT